MDFQQQQITSNLFDGMMESDDLFCDFENESQNSLLGVMADAIENQVKPQLSPLKQIDNFKSGPMVNEENDIHESIGQCLLFEEFKK